MFCNKCGTQLEDGAKFCPSCGTPVGNEVNNNMQEQPMAQPMGAQVQQPGLAWANFLGYFAIWFGSLLNLISAIQMLTGLVYNAAGGSADLVYAVFGTGLMVLDKVYGALLLGLVVLGVMTALSIIKRKKNTGKLLTILYAGVIIVSILYIVITSAILGSSTLDASSGTSIVVSVIMLIVNHIYFKKRQHIFVN